MNLEKKIALYVAIGLVIILGSALRIYNLGEKSLDVDDFNSVRDSESVHWWSGHPPLYFFILHIFMAMGTSDLILGLPSVIFGVLTIPLSYKIGRLFFGPKEGLLSAFLLSISWMHIYYSQKVRMYSLFAFLSVSSLFFFYKYILLSRKFSSSFTKISFFFSKYFKEKNKMRIWIGFILSTVLSLYTHYFAVFVVLVEIMFFIFILISNLFSNPAKERSREWRKRAFLLFVLSMMIVSLSLVPIIITRLPNVYSLIEKPYSYVGEEQYGSVLELSFLPKLLSWFSNLNEVVLYMYLLFFLFGSILSIRKFREQITLLFIWFILPIILTYLLSTRVYIRSQPRYLIFILPIYLLIISRGMTAATELISRGKISVTPSSQLIKKSGMSLLVLFLILTVVFSLSVPSLQEHYSYDEENWKAVSNYLESKSQPTDVIIIEPSFATRVFLHYYGVASKNNLVTTPYGSLSELKDICRYNRVWFVYAYNYAKRFDEKGKTKHWLNENFERKENFGGISVFFLSPQEHPIFKAGIFCPSKDQDRSRLWTSSLTVMGGATRIFNETTIISKVNLSEFDIVVFVEFKHPLNDLERLHIKEAIQNGLTVIVSGLSPYYLAAGTNNLTQISSWFGATVFSQSPKEAKWNVKFTENATEIMKDLDLGREYEFYTDSDWTTPTGCIVQLESVVYAYRVNDQAAVIFSHKFGKGTLIFNGARHGFWCKDAKTWEAFLRALIRSAL